MASVLSPDLEWVKKSSGIMKILTVLVNIVCIGILVDNIIAPMPKASFYFLPVTTGGFLLVDIFLMLSYTVDGNHGKIPITELTIAGLGAIFHLAAGSIAIDAYSSFTVGKGSADAYGAFSIINAAVYAATGYFILRQASTDYEEPAAT